MTVKKPTVIKTFITKNKYSRPGSKRSRTTKIAWHYTGAHDVSAKATVNYFKNLATTHTTYASSHYVCGLEGEIYYIVPESEIAYTTNSANYYSIGIECATTGSDDHYSDKEYVSMVKLGAYLADKYNLDPRTDFIRHYDVTKKICPRYFVNNSKKWKQFKLDCYNYMKGKLTEENIRNCTNGKGASILTETEEPEAFKQYIVRCTADVLNGRTGPGTNYDVETQLTKGTAVTIVSEKTVDGVKWGKTKSEYWICLKYTDFIRFL